MKQYSIRPIVENGKYCCTVELPAQDEYTENQQRVFRDLQYLCFNCRGSLNGRIFVLPFDHSHADMNVVWENIINNFGPFVFVEKVC